MLVGEDEGVAGFFQVFNRFVDLLDGFEVLFAGVFHGGKPRSFPFVHVLFKISDVDILIFDDGEFVFVFEGIEGGVSKESNHGDKKLRPYHIHFGIAVGNIDDAGII